MLERVDQIVDPKTPLLHIDKANCYALAQAFRNNAYDYTCSIITVYVASTINLGGATYATAVRSVYKNKVQKESHCMVTIDGCHRRRTVKMIKNEDAAKRAANTLRMHYAFRVNGKPVRQPLAKRLSKIPNTSTAIVRRKVTFKVAM